MRVLRQQAFEERALQTAPKTLSRPGSLKQDLNRKGPLGFGGQQNLSGPGYDSGGHGRCWAQTGVLWARRGHLRSPGANQRKTSLLGGGISVRHPLGALFERTPL